MNAAEMLGLDPVFPLLQVLFLGIAAAALAVWLYRRQETGRRNGGLVLSILRGVAVAAIALVLLNPVRTRAQKETGKPPLLVLVDTSHSMSQADVDGKPRLEAAKGALGGDRGL